MTDAGECRRPPVSCRMRKTGPLSGAVAIPGDKSVSHRSLIFSALAQGESTITGLLQSDDVLHTADALRLLGVEIRREDNVWRVTGNSWKSPEDVLFFGNSGTGARLMAGAVAAAGISAVFDGDASLRARPMGRVLDPLRRMGLEADDTNGCLPVRFGGGRGLRAIDTVLEIPSAQVKSAIMLAALGADGTTCIHEPRLCRDHTERMLEAFGVFPDYENDGRQGRFIRIEGGRKLHACNMQIPGDPSSAAFPVAAAAIVPGSDVTVRNVMMNPARTGFFDTLAEMGADIRFTHRRRTGSETVCDIRIRHAPLSGVTVPPERAPSMIDEYPVLAVVAAFADGDTVMEGLAELRVKESDRIAAVCDGLMRCGVAVRSGRDSMHVSGSGLPPRGGGCVETRHDHRIAMSFLVMGTGTQNPVEVDDLSMIATSFPDFMDTMQALGAGLESA